MILALGSAADSTFLHLLGALRRRTRDVAAVDVVQLAADGGYVLDADDPTRSVLRVAGREHALRDVDACWVRLPGLTYDGLADEKAALVNATTRALSFTALALARRGVPVVNPPTVDPSSFSKPAHLLHLAHRVGFEVPVTCVTNVPERALAFVDEHGGDVLYKGVSSMKTWARRWEDADRDRLDAIRGTPVQLQRIVRGPDVRVHVAAGTVHAELIRSAELDYRPRGTRNTYAPVDPPPAVTEGCLRLSELLGAPLLGVDFKIDDERGAWVFLEANGMPCFEGYDRRAGGAISAALVEHLTGGR